MLKSSTILLVHKALQINVTNFHIDNSKADYGKLERVFGEFNHSWAAPHLYKQVRHIRIITSIICITSKIFNIIHKILHNLEIFDISNIYNIYLQEQCWQNCLVPHILHQPRHILAKKFKLCFGCSLSYSPTNFHVLCPILQLTFMFLVRFSN